MKRTFSFGDFALLILGALILGTLIACLLAWPVMLLWNWLMPAIFGLMQINFWEALGLSVLAGLLFKNPSTSSK